MQRLWIVSRICEEFHCLPDVAESLWLDDETRQVMDMLMLRSYARAKQQYDEVDGKVERLDKSWLMDEVIRNDFAMQKER